MKKTIFILSLYALSNTSFAACFEVHLSCEESVNYCPQEGDTIEQISQDVLDIDNFICE
ncbi:hypothetical protein [Myroides sp. DW712]|uniref:hypothetical protein n=1 Tax=Myroides sp. DW712 TaxID=3389800 RepID=UPI003977FA34